MAMDIISKKNVDRLVSIYNLMTSNEMMQAEYERLLQSETDVKSRAYNEYQLNTVREMHGKFEEEFNQIYGKLAQRYDGREIKQEMLSKFQEEYNKLTSYASSSDKKAYQIAIENISEELGISSAGKSAPSGFENNQEEAYQPRGRSVAKPTYEVSPQTMGNLNDLYGVTTFFATESPLRE